MHDQDTLKINRYLLGELPPEEMDALEARLLTESGLFELAEAVEDGIIDRYVRGELSPGERRRFERRLLPSSRIQERVAFARALASREKAKRSGAPQRPAAVVPLLRSPARLAWAATLVAVLAAGALAVEVARLRDRAGELELARSTAVAELEEARRTDPAPAPIGDRTDEEADEDPDVERLAEELATARDRVAELEAREKATTERRVRRPRDIREDVETASLFLSLATRAGAEPEVLRLSGLGGAERVALQLDLSGQRPRGSVVATLLRGGEPVYRDAVPVKAFEGESMASLVVPRSILFQGRYRIEVAVDEPGSPDDLLGTYELSVTP